ncbi:hypothetical protein [Lachnoclostridium sp. An138]|uniref:hypothetical protein n=1 Tax=Lachnoclostridium sp. An138 TaxID=1965560 RepID=UPI000B3706CE|nr:hypothetical protein [Lachnoclostridium sp. An138]OUQ14545.1 hypothetical protein B5E82_16870 [Lachnoclostridium sp. An138]
MLTGIINPYSEIVVCGVLSYFAAYMIVMAKERGKRYLYATIYLGFVFLWRSLERSVGMALQSILVRIDTTPQWKKTIEFPLWVSAFAVILLIQIITRQALRKWIKVNSGIYIIVFSIIIGGFIWWMIEHCSYFYLW